VGPRRALQRLYDTPEKKAARPWAPILNWAVIASLYGLTLLAVCHRQILFADVPPDDLPTYVAQRWEIGVVVGANLALALVMWIMTKKYTDSLLQQAAETGEASPLGTTILGTH